MDNKTKYDYITENNLNDYITEDKEKLFEESKTWFKLTKNQYAQKLKFEKEHHDCLIDKDTMRHRFGTIGGGIVIKYKINKDTIIPFIKCEWCKENKELIDELPENIDIQELDNRYERYSKYPDKFNKVEFYRFMNILEDFKDESIEVGFMGTGLGDIINISVKDNNFSITDTSHW